MLFTERFNEVLKNSSVTQSEVAMYCGVTKQSISDFKRGKSLPSIETLYRICKILDCSSDYLLGLSDI